jgi:hypothetical protein
MRRRVLPLGRNPVSGFLAEAGCVSWPDSVPAQSVTSGTGGMNSPAVRVVVDQYWFYLPGKRASDGEEEGLVRNVATWGRGPV